MSATSTAALVWWTVIVIAHLLGCLLLLPTISWHIVVALLPIPLAHLWPACNSRYGTCRHTAGHAKAQTTLLLQDHCFVSPQHSQALYEPLSPNVKTRIPPHHHHTYSNQPRSDNRGTTDSPMCSQVDMTRHTESADKLVDHRRKGSGTLSPAFDLLPVRPSLSPAPTQALYCDFVLLQHTCDWPPTTPVTTSSSSAPSFSPKLRLPAATR